MLGNRIEWIDQARGLAIFLVVYGHNFPFCEAYIYSFHVPLFFLISGMFHPKTFNVKGVLQRAKVILVPYFLWAILLYLFWFLLGRNYGNSAGLDLSPSQNLLGVFYAQGGQPFMDWGIPIWFLPCLFLVYLFFGLLLRSARQVVTVVLLCLLIGIGFVWPYLTTIHLPWSIDVAFVALSFYAIGNRIKPFLQVLTRQKAVIYGLFLVALNVIAFYLNTEKIDMYRSTYGNPFLFMTSGVAGALGFMMLLKALNVSNILSYLGKNSVVILAAHTRALTVIKLLLLLVFELSVFEFSELEKLILAVVQIGLLVPVIWIINRYIPILNAKRGKTS